LERIVCQFSCGATSAVATKLALAEFGKTHEVLIVNAFLKEEHRDNRRFLADCERWFGRQVMVLRDEKYGASTVEVFRRERFMKGPNGSPCTRILKRKLLNAIVLPDDVIVFGYDADEPHRLDDRRELSPEIKCVAPLIDRGLTKSDCKAMVERAGIELPLMYRLGYSNANCIGCVKGGEGYWRAIREDFPQQFEEMAAVQEQIGPGAYLFRNRKTGVRYSLRQIPPGPVRRDEEMPSCSFFCEAAEREIFEVCGKEPA
jgi:3'-phosphoadenosine 5'-phosphosulfate sulfotransferase (PAPS reductase)/FAD synthetase